jgi:hypothetical protein
MYFGAAEAPLILPRPAPLCSAAIGTGSGVPLGADRDPAKTTNSSTFEMLSNRQPQGSGFGQHSRGNLPRFHLPFPRERERLAKKCENFTIAPWRDASDPDTS